MGNHTALQHAKHYVSGGRRGQSESLHASHAKADKLFAPHAAYLQNQPLRSAGGAD
jgi:hypothetical protein